MRESRGVRCASSGAHNLTVDGSRRDDASHARRSKGQKTKTRGSSKGHVANRRSSRGGSQEYLFHLLFKPPVGGPIRDVNVVSLPGTAGEQGDNTACPIENDSTRISWSGKRATLPVIWQNGHLHGRVRDAVIGIDASERPKAVSVTDGGARSHAVLHYKERLIAVSIAVLGMADLVVRHDVRDWEKRPRCRRSRLD